jgi:hypothetical protein
MRNISRVKEKQTMAYYTSQAQDAAERIKQATIAVEAADAAYRKGGGLDALNKANAKLADAHSDLYVADGGTMLDHR